MNFCSETQERIRNGKPFVCYVTIDGRIEARIVQFVQVNQQQGNLESETPLLIIESSVKPPSFKRGIEASESEQEVK